MRGLVIIGLALLFLKSRAQAAADKGMADLEESFGFGTEPDPTGGSVTMGCVFNVNDPTDVACPEDVPPCGLDPVTGRPTCHDYGVMR